MAIPSLNKDILDIIYRYIHRSYTKRLHIDLKYQTRILRNDLVHFAYPSYNANWLLTCSFHVRNFHVRQLKIPGTHHYERQWAIKEGDVQK